MRIALPVVTGLLVVIIFALVRNSPVKAPITTETVAVTDGGIVIRNPRFSDVNSVGGIFNLTADAAREDPQMPGLVQLDAIKANVKRADGFEILLSAPKGEMQREENRLTLFGGTHDSMVSLSTSDGYQIDMPRLHIDVDERSVTTDRPVSGRGPMGGFRADRMVVQENGGRLSLIGGVEILIAPGNQRGP